MTKPILAVCGKGGVGKTAVSALLARAVLDHGATPLLLIDADPVTGLTQALGERAWRTLAEVRAHLIASARDSDDTAREQLARELDYLVLEALQERDGYALLAMGRTAEKGCFCPVNTLLRHAIDALAEPFAAVLIDAEAGVEQISREVTQGVTQVVVVTDGSRRSVHTLEVIVGMIGAGRVAVVENRGPAGRGGSVPEGVRRAGAVPEDAALGELDRQGRSLWELPTDNPARVAARSVAARLGLLGDAP